LIVLETDHTCGGDQIDTAISALFHRMSIPLGVAGIVSQRRGINIAANKIIELRDTIGKAYFLIMSLPLLTVCAVMPPDWLVEVTFSLVIFEPPKPRAVTAS